ncbi:diacylglycerol pyrophosphate phosphatase [Scheffersomyces coipomensis]|uniref:diacylglycerol pyrophosphate phosphatase n=1 Tax=Scheffersomyces coipomensis TaxID=1788519 RepID=UPI00315C8019
MIHTDLPDWSIRLRNHNISGLTFFSYILDWLIYISILLTFIIFGTTAPPRYHEFSINDISLMYSYKPEDETAVPLVPLILIAVGIPIIQFIVCSLINNHTLSKSRQFWDIYIGLMCLCGGMAIQLMFTVILKNICGLPRPDLLSRCQPNLTTEPPLQLATVTICSNPNINLIQEGFRSFPSGHSSTVFCGMVISSLNIAGKLQVFDKRGISFKVILAIFPIMIACFVSCTRISDNRHFLRDVIGGSIIGTAVAVWFYSQYFPSIFDLENCGRAYPPRRLGVANFLNNVGGFWKIKDILPGSFNERVLNSVDVIKQVEEITPIDIDINNDIDDNLNSYVEIPKNIQLFNKLKIDLKDRYFNFNKHLDLPLYFQIVCILISLFNLLYKIFLACFLADLSFPLVSSTSLLN